MKKYKLAVKEISSLFDTTKTAFRLRQDYNRLLDALNQEPKQNPDPRFIHVAGTNGKGSVCHKISRILSSAGYKTGLYTSPHIFSFTQRMAIDGTSISESEFADIYNNISDQMKKHSFKLNFFEILTAMAFKYFRKCDAVVLETGMGGRYDATNIVEPILSIITSIGYDHTAILGETLEKIAYQKAGIIKKGVSVVLGPECQPISVFQDEAKLHGSTLYRVPQIGHDFRQTNNKIVRLAAEVLKKEGYFSRISENDIQQGLNAEAPCRMQVMNSSGKEFILDVGHNPPALRSLVDSLRHRGGHYIFVYGTSSAKDCQKSIEEIVKFANKIYLVEARHRRAMPIEILSLFNSGTVVQNGNINKTIQHIKQNEEGSVVICGSFFIMQEAIEAIRGQSVQNEDNTELFYK